MISITMHALHHHSTMPCGCNAPSVEMLQYMGGIVVIRYHQHQPLLTDNLLVPVFHRVHMSAGKHNVSPCKEDKFGYEVCNDPQTSTFGNMLIHMGMQDEAET